MCYVYCSCPGRTTECVMSTVHAHCQHVYYTVGVNKCMDTHNKYTIILRLPILLFIIMQDSVYFESFRKYCILGFLSLRRRANFVLNLFRLVS